MHADVQIAASVAKAVQHTEADRKDASASVAHLAELTALYIRAIPLGTMIPFANVRRLRRPADAAAHARAAVHSVL